MDVDEDHAPHLHLLKIARPAIRHHHRYIGQDGQGPLRGLAGSGKMAGVAFGSGQGKELGIRRNFLEKNKVGRSLMEKGREAGHGGHVGSVEGKDGEKVGGMGGCSGDKRLGMVGKNRGPGSGGCQGGVAEAVVEAGGAPRGGVG
jgi:hypothetical protein